MKRWYGMGRVRYLGLARNACHLQLVAMAMNMKRALVLRQAARDRSQERRVRDAGKPRIASQSGHKSPGHARQSPSSPLPPRPNNSLLMQSSQSFAFRKPEVLL